MPTIKFDSDYKPEKVINSKDKRPHLRRVMVIDQQTIAASNGAAMVVLPARIEGSIDWTKGPHLSLAALAAARVEQKGLHEVALPIEEGVANVDVLAACPSGGEYIDVTLDPRLLLSLAEALASKEGVTLRIRNNSGTIEVKADREEWGAGRPFGLLAPRIPRRTKSVADMKGGK